MLPEEEHLELRLATAAGGSTTPPEDISEPHSPLTDWYWLKLYRKFSKSDPGTYHYYYRNYINWYSNNKCA